jgi:hypothetical protein
MEQSYNKTKDHSQPTSLAVTESFSTIPGELSKANDTKLRIRNAITQLELLYRSLSATESIPDRPSVESRLTESKEDA